MKISTLKMAVALLGALSFLSVQGAHISPEAALQRVKSPNAPMRIASSSSLDLVYSCSAAYVFQDRSAGFLVLSADDNAYPVLGYSDCGVFNPENIPDGLKYMLSFYEQEIAAAGDVAARDCIYPASPVGAVEPLVTTRWNQDAPYNNDTPRINGKATYTGCVATSTSQVMNYHEWPAVGQGSNSVKCNNQTYTVNFSQHPFAWSDMRDTYGSDATDAQKKAVANLMYCVGVGVDMEYGTSESGATPAAIPYALVEYFKYDKGCHIERRTFYALEDWQELIYGELKEGRPVVYNGESEEGGHSFVCDGYSSDGYFHINWGWGGMSDGYFKLNALNPGVQGIGGSGIGFNGSQSAIVGIRKPVSGSQYHYTLGLSGSLRVSEKSVSVGSDITLEAGTDGGFFNYSAFSIPSAQLGVECTAEGETAQYWTDGSMYGEIKVNYGFRSFEVPTPSSLSDGTYQLRPVWRVTKNDSWQYVQLSISSPQYVTMKVSGGVATFSTESSAEKLEVSVMSTTPFYYGDNVKITINVKNPSDTEYYGGLVAALCEPGTSDSSQTGDTLYIDVLPGESKNYDYIMKVSANPGQYVLYIASEYGDILSEGQTVNVQESYSQTQISINNFKFVGDAANADKNHLKFSFDLACVSGYFADELTLAIFPESGGESVATASTGYLFVNAGNSQPVTVSVGYSGGEAGSRYMAGVYYGQQCMSGNYVTFTLGDDNPSGVAATGLSEEGRTTYYTIDGVRVENPRGGLFIKVTENNKSKSVQKIIIGK